jgi:serine/threonine protein kinase
MYKQESKWPLKINRDKIKSAKMDQNIKREIDSMKRFRHPHIVKLYGKLLSCRFYLINTI